MRLIVIAFFIFAFFCNNACSSSDSSDSPIKNENPQVTQGEKQDIKSIFEMAIRTFCSDVESPDNTPGKPLELKDLFVKNASIYPRWDGPYLEQKYYKYIGLFTVKSTKETNSDGNSYWKYEVVEK